MSLDEKRCQACRNDLHDHCDDSDELHACRCSECVKLHAKARAPINIDEIRQRAERFRTSPLVANGIDIPGILSTNCEGFGEREFRETEADINDIVAAVNAVPALCDEVERLRAEVTKLRAADRESLDDADVEEPLVRYGIQWTGPTSPVSVPMDGGYWTSWHLANAKIERLRAENAKLREVAQEVISRFPFEAEEIPISTAYNEYHLERTGRQVCTCCLTALGDHRSDCLYALAERALANGGAGGG